jgi:ATP-dependent DNA helicase DinG
MTADPVWVGVAAGSGEDGGPVAFSVFLDEELLRSGAGDRESVSALFHQALSSTEHSRILAVSASGSVSLPLDLDIVPLTELSGIAFPTLLEQNAESIYEHLGMTVAGDLLKQAQTATEVARLMLEKLAGLDHSDLMMLFSLCPKHIHPFIETAIEIRSASFLLNERFETKSGGRSISTFFECNPEKPRLWEANDQEIDSILDEDGPLATSIGSFEERPEQKELAHQVMESFRGGTISVIEAPTGTGKTIGYLVPSVLWSVSTGRKVVVSTHTITLQDQLFFKDAPQVLAALGVKGKVSILKGRRNYLCLKRWKTLRASGIPDEQRNTLGPVVVWLSETESGDVSENSGLDLSSEECRKAWGRVSCDIPFCPASRCPEYRQCYLFKARREAESAALIIINHSLLFCDRFLGNALLPPFEELIVDEAHSLEEVARDQLGVRLSQGRVGVALTEVSDAQEPRLLERLSELSKLAASSGKETLQTIVKRALKAVKESRKESGSFFEALEELHSEMSAASRHVGKLRYQEDDRLSRRLAAASMPLCESFEEIHRALRAMIDFCSEIPVDDPQAILQEIEIRAEDFSRLVEDLELLANPVGSEWVYWIEAIPGRRPELRASPVELKDALSDLIYEQLSSLVLTSGTLSYQGGFTHFAETLGISTSRTTFHRLESSFPLFEQVELLASATIPRPDRPGNLEAVSSFIRNLFEDSKANTLALFTSYASLEFVHSAIADSLNRVGVKVFRQGRGEAPQRIAELFRRTKHSLLLGTMSFWEGVDLPGECLERLVITRLPFPVPTEPVVEGIMERMQARGDDPFQDYMLPVASIRLRQGFGRLIRSKDDKGIVIILDPRFLGSSYGHLLADEMPVDVERLPEDLTLSGLTT